MAYLCMNFAAATNDAADHDATIAAPAAMVGFSSREWTVVTLAHKDRALPTKPASRLRRFIAMVFGLPVANPLADERLEVLRVAASRLWRGHAALDDGLLPKPDPSRIQPGASEASAGIHPPERNACLRRNSEAIAVLFG